MSPPYVTSCHGCDLLVEAGEVLPGSTAFCPRCGSKVHTPKTDSLNRTLAFTFIVLLVYVPAVFTPLMTLNALGMETSGSILDNSIFMYRQGYIAVASMVFLTAILLPFLNPALLFLLAALAKTKRLPRFQAWLLRTFQSLEEWGMGEVYLIGVLVTIIKVYSMASITFNIGFFCFLVMVVMNLCALSVLDKSSLWIQIDEQLGFEDHGGISGPIAEMQTAMEAGLMCCHECGKLTKGDDVATEDEPECPRCGAALHYRKPDSLSRTWALVAASAILFVPANVLPIMRVDFLGASQYSTIMDGIIYFMHSGEYGIAVVIFTASVLVPVYKIIGLALALLSVQLGWQGRRRQKTLMFRFIEFIGRWSMLDIFVIALMAVLVNFGEFSSTHAAIGAPFFAGVVTFTMLAALTFDARLLWDGRCDKS
ncbi:paraquat-inducible protein A [Desulfoluna butyratoxydans]|uniref:Paraquat-inducible protein a n=1 Tax=Desulfoluna butyratoxydans TaxID=231438 RepID=A0A4U8YLY9_9BACT|nr:paraquat-inducible protein A [Desulfoluna butyratoxydans]VFQ45006.1 paraquat-inducible protein a [Desulfoluna butyratoxydans]